MKRPRTWMMTALFTGFTALCIGDNGETADIDGAISALRSGAKRRAV